MAVTKQFQNLDFQYNQALKLVLDRQSVAPTITASMPGGAIYYNTNTKVPYYLHRATEPSGTGSWAYMFAYMNASLSAFGSGDLDITNDRLLVWDASTSTYKVVAPEHLTSAAADVKVKMRSDSAANGFLSEVLAGATNGGVVYNWGTGGENVGYSHIAVGNLVEQTTNLANTYHVAVSASANNTVSTRVTLEYINRVMTFLKLVDVSPSTFSGSGNHILRVNAAANAVEFTQYVPTTNGGTNANLSGSANGALFYYNTTGNLFTALSQGVSGQVLQSNGATIVPSWVDKWTNKSYVASFEVGDWDTGGSFPVIEILNATHGLGVGSGFSVQAYELSGTTYDLVELSIKIESTTGAVTLESSAAFDGYAVIIKHQ